MSQKNEAVALVLSVLISASLAGAVLWWFNSANVKKDSLGNQSPVPNQPESNSQANSEKSAETFASVQNVPKRVFNYGGSTTWAPIRRDVDAAIQTVYPQFRLRYTQPSSGTVSSGTGIRMLLDNQLSFAQSSSPLKTKDYGEAKQRGFELKEIPVAIDAFAVVVHPTLNIPGLSVEQLDRIFEGKITNWQEVGGADLKIRPYRKGTPEPGSYMQFVPTTTEAVRRVEKEPGAIFQASASLLVTQCTVKMLPLIISSSKFITPYKLPLASGTDCRTKGNQLNKEAFLSGEYPITRRLFVVTKQNNSLDRQGGETYANLMLTEQGQALIEKAGFVRIR
jgi:phosphate transport system substrate-binding protein